MASAALTDSEVMQLIELYREQENLYNMHMRDYFDKQKTRESLQYMCRALGRNWTEQMLRTKLKNIRSSYTRELNSFRDRMTSGTSTDEVRKPKWKWFSLLDSFLRPFCTTRKGLSSLVAEGDVSSTGPSTSSQVPSVDGQLESLQTLSASGRSAPQFGQPVKRKRDPAYEILDVVRDEPERKQAKSINAQFALYIAAELDAFSEEKQRAGRRRILDVIARMQEES